MIGKLSFIQIMKQNIQYTNEIDEPKHKVLLITIFRIKGAKCEYGWPITHNINENSHHRLH